MEHDQKQIDELLGRTPNAKPAENIPEVLPIDEEYVQTSPHAHTVVPPVQQPRSSEPEFESFALPQTKRSLLPWLLGGTVGLVILTAGICIGLWIGNGDSKGSQPLASGSSPTKKNVALPKELPRAKPALPRPKLPPRQLDPFGRHQPVNQGNVKPAPIVPVELAGAGISNDWLVILRSHDPSIWNQEVKKDPSHYARRIADVPDNIRFLRIRRNKDYVIIPMKKEDLTRRVDTKPVGWDGTNRVKTGVYHLGIFDLSKPLRIQEQVCIRSIGWHSGWGFGRKLLVRNEQAYCWDGDPIAPTVLEFAVKPSKLTAAEKEKMARRVVTAAPIKPAILEGPEISKGWKLLFRSADGGDWNQDVNDGHRYACPVATTLADIRYLRIRKDADYVIIPISKERLLTRGLEGDVGWEGTGDYHCTAYHLGVFRESMRCRERREIAVAGGFVCRGWGMGHGHFHDDKQYYSWSGREVATCVFEIAVTSGPLTAQETAKLLK